MKKKYNVFGNLIVEIDYESYAPAILRTMKNYLNNEEWNKDKKDEFRELAEKIYNGEIGWVKGIVHWEYRVDDIITDTIECPSCIKDEIYMDLKEYAKKLFDALINKEGIPYQALKEGKCCF
jgi:hypothetical protein